MELIQDTEYETMIQCRVAMTKSCEDNTIEDTITKSEEACHTVYEKECKTVYRPHRSKVRHILLFHYLKEKNTRPKPIVLGTLIENFFATIPTSTT